MKQISCAICKDLMPLCAEELCSEESRKAVEHHVQTCESCRLLHVQTPEVPAPEKLPVPEEGKAFRKINRQLKHGKLKIAALSILLTGILTAVAWQTIKIIRREPGEQSIETLAQSLQIRKIVKMLEVQDFDCYTDTVFLGGMDNAYLAHYEDEIRRTDVENLKRSWQAAYADNPIDHININSYYESFHLPGYESIVTYVTIWFADGNDLILDYVRSVDGTFQIGGGFLSHSYSDSEANVNFANCINFIGTHDLYPSGFTEKTLSRTEPVPKKSCAFFSSLVSNRFAPEYREQIAGKLQAFFEEGYYFSNVIFSQVRYDEEKQTLYYDVSFTAEDGQGSAVLLTRFDVDYKGLRPSLPAQYQLCPNGCTDVLTAELSAIFG